MEPKSSRDPLACASSPAAFAHYEQRIRALTSLLDRAACHEPVTNLDPSDPEGNSELRSYYFAATLLTMGTHETNCAVTAIVLPNVVKCIVAVLGDYKEPHMGCYPKAEIHTIEERRIDLITLGSGSSNVESVSFEEHAADLLHALRTFHTTVDPQSDVSPYWYFLRFVVRRCYLKIADRISNGDKIWRVHPMKLLRKWDPPSGKGAFKRTEFQLQHQILQATLAVYDIHPISQTPDGHAIYYFARDNAKAWARVACALFKVLEDKLMTPYFDGNAPPRLVPRASMDAESIAVVADYLDTFSVILDSHPMKEILSHPSYTSKLQPLDEPEPINKDAPGTIPDLADPDNDALAREEEETAGGHVFRYLRAIVAWVNASLSLTQHEAFRSSLPIELYIVHVPPAPPSDRLTALPSIRAEVLGRFSVESPEEARAEAFFEAEERMMRTPVFGGSVHTECALLGVLAGGAPPGCAEAVKSLFECDGKPLGSLPEIFQGYLAIGSTRNCCACCWRLSQELSLSLSRPILLSGTHGIIRPWTPPRVGIPPALLRAVDKAMMDTLRALAVDPTRALQARQAKAREAEVEVERKRPKGGVGCFGCLTC